MKKVKVFMTAALTAVSFASMAQQTDYPWMDKSKSFRERAELLCKELTLREKVDQLGNNVSEPIKRNGQVILPSYQYWNEALHGWHVQELQQVSLSRKECRQHGMRCSSEHVLRL